MGTAPVALVSCLSVDNVKPYVWCRLGWVLVVPNLVLVVDGG